MKKVICETKIYENKSKNKFKVCMRERERALIVDIKNKNAIVRQNERTYLNLTIWRGNGEKCIHL